MSIFKDKTIRALLFGNDATFNEQTKHRISTWTFPASSDEDVAREIKYPMADGFILYLIKRIEKLEAEVSTLKSKKR